MSKLDIQYVPIDQLRTYEKNPRYIKDDAYHRLTKKMLDFGWLAPLHANDHADFKDVVFSGNMRLRIANELVGSGLKAVNGEDFQKAPVIYMTLDEESDMYRQSLILNSHEGKWDYDLLSTHTAEFDIEPIDVEFLAGIDLGAIPNLNGQDFQPTNETNTFDDIAENQRKPKMIVCPHCNEEFDLREIE